MATAFLGLPTVSAGTLIKASDWNSMVNKIDAAIKKIMVVEKLQKSLWVNNTIYPIYVSNALTLTTITVPSDYSYFKVYSYATITPSATNAIAITDTPIEPSKITKLSVNSSQDINALHPNQYGSSFQYAFYTIRFTQTNATTIALNLVSGSVAIDVSNLYLEFYKYETVSV